LIVVDGRFFEDFTLGEEINHATPRTMSAGDAALYQALYGGRHLLNSSHPHATRHGYHDRPLDDWLVFHIVFGKTVPDISRHAIANLGYAEGLFRQPVYVGDTLSACSTVIGLRANSNGKSGIVMVRSRGENQNGETVLEYVRWVMVHKRDPESPAPEAHMPELAEFVAADALVPPTGSFADWDSIASGSDRWFGDYAIGEKLSHCPQSGGGTTLEEAEHMMATRLYQNTAQVHFDGLAQSQTRFGKRLIYGGHIISHARAMSFNGLENALGVAALNSGTHAAPAFAGDTIYAWSEICDKAEAVGRDDIGALRVRHYVQKNAALPQTNSALSAQPEEATADSSLILHLDCWVWIPR
jgi:2-methylfumaryl-CoA hydratase